MIRLVVRWINNRQGKIDHHSLTHVQREADAGEGEREGEGERDSHSNEKEKH